MLLLCLLYRHYSRKVEYLILGGVHILFWDELLGDDYEKK